MEIISRGVHKRWVDRDVPVGANDVGKSAVAFVGLGDVAVTEAKAVLSNGVWVFEIATIGNRAVDKLVS